MATLEDKILGEKLEYYCSSDEDKGESDEESSEDAKASNSCAEADAAPAQPNINYDGTSNTGPKGVIKDYQRFKQLEAEKRQEQEKERIALAQKLSFTCRSALDDEDDPEFAELLDDPFVLEYAKQRMQEMMAKSTVSTKFGSVACLRTGEEYLEAIDKEDQSVTVVVFVWEEHIASCRVMAEAIDELSQQYQFVKFCKISAETAGLSRNFRADGVPALLVYKAGQLVGNYIQLGQEFGTEFTSNDVYNYLAENGICLDGSVKNKTVR